MTIDEIKTAIEQRTGVPADLLTGETAEETIAQAKALLAYKKENEPKRPKTAAEQFADWAAGQLDSGARRTAEVFGLSYTARGSDSDFNSLAEIEEAAREAARKYPAVRDGGEALSDMPDPRPTREQFAGYAGQKMAFDPRKDAQGWKHI